MKLKTIIAAVLVSFGVMAFAYQGISSMTPERDINIGSLHMSTRDEHFILLPPILGAIALIGGIALLLVDKNDFKPTPTP